MARFVAHHADPSNDMESLGGSVFHTFDQLRKYLALEWVYASHSAFPDSTPPEEKTLVPIPKEELTALLGLAKGGKIGAIRKQLAKIEELDEQYKPFIEELRKITKSFDMAQLRKFLMTYADPT